MRKASLLFMAVLAAAFSAAHAQSGRWPEKTIRIVVATAPGSADDFVARLMAPNLRDLLGQPVIVENRPGAAGLIGQTLVLKSPSDGYTLLYAGGSMAGARYVNANASYDVLRDFTPVSSVMTTMFVMLVHPTLPARNLKEYIALARSQPGKMTYGVSGIGQIPYWSALLFNNMARIKAVEVSYKTGSAGALVDLMAGELDYLFVASPVAAAQKTRVRALAVTGAYRSPAFPEVPTVAEAALPGYEMPGWAGIMGPAAMRRDVVDTLNASIARTLAVMEIRERMQAVGVETMPSTPEGLARMYSEWMERFGRIAKQAGVRPQ